MRIFVQDQDSGPEGDERILGDSDFVEKVLSQASEQMERRYRLKAEAWTLTKITERVAKIFGIEKDQVVVAGKQPGLLRFFRTRIRR